jgi:hypothetical protein
LRLVAQFNDVTTEMEIKWWVLLGIRSGNGGKRKEVVTYIHEVSL